MLLKSHRIRFLIGAQMLVAAFLLSGCLDPPLKELNPCLVSGVIIDQDVNKVDKIDMLFVIDNSVSMMQEQEKLRDQIPRMIKVLTTGDKSPDNGREDNDFPPVKDLHLALVSSDMGLPNIPPEENPDQTGACYGTGDDGNFLNDPSLAIAAGMSCPGIGGGAYPLFLEHERQDKESAAVTIQRAEATAAAFGCISFLSTTGCGFEMQLEAPLKALWPSQINNLNEEQLALQVKFLAGSQGHGDSDHALFLRGTSYHPTQPDQVSLLAIIVVTDEEDCSAGARGDLEFLSLNFPGGERTDLNLRCYKDTVNNWGNKYPVDRYINGFKALRPSYPDLVVFGAIAGIPPNIEEDANKDNEVTESERENYYNEILNHDLMQEIPDPDTKNLNYSCTQDDNMDGIFETQAFPARRLTEVARGFGATGIIRSICASNFTPAMDAIIDVISNKIGGVCLPRAYTRDSDGKVGCDVVWTMPPGWSCADAVYLKDPEPEKPQVSDDGRKLCVVNQIAVKPGTSDNPAVRLDLNTPPGLGWYYDDFSLDMQNTCKLQETITTKQRISFTLNPGMQGANEDPPSGVSIDLECLNQIPTPTSDAIASKVGLACEKDGVQQCPPKETAQGAKPGTLFCHDTTNVCVMKCSTDADCKDKMLAGWVCDDRKGSEGYLNKSSQPICVNPTCK
ncbi:MAG: hypothetical protein JXA30_07690 [Deltaproteobacteria bacterium]|nr:hypothetical protein [Deltaproteobacteria bacterium]